MVKDEFVNQGDVAEVVPEAQDPTDDEMEEIDMRNNSSAYFDKHGDSVYMIASHPTLPLIVSGGGDEKAYLWTTNREEPVIVAELKFNESVAAGGFTADGNFLILGDMSGLLRVYRRSKNGEKWTELGTADEVDEIVKIVIHPVHPVFAVLADDGSVWCYDISSEGEGTLLNVSVLNFHTGPTVAVFTDDGKDGQPKLFTASEDGNMRLWDVYSGSPEYTVDHKKLHGNYPFVSVCVSPARMAVAAGSMDGQLFFIKVADGTVLHMIDASAKESKPVNVITDPSKLIGAGAADEGSNNEDEDVSGESIEGLAWSATRNFVATGNVDGIVTLWDAVSYRPRTHFVMQDSVTQLEFLPGTTLLAVASMDSTLTLFDTTTSQKVFECLGHSEGVLGFAVQQKGKRLVTAGDDSVCLIFNRE